MMSAIPKDVRDEVVGVGEGAFERVQAQAHPRPAVLKDERDGPALRRDAVVIGDLPDRARAIPAST